MKLSIHFGLTLLCLFLYIPGKTQTSSPEQDSLRILRNEIHRLDSILQNIQKKMEANERENEFQNLLDQAEQLGEKEKEEKIDVSKKFLSGTRKQQGLNPNISLGGDFFGAMSTTDYPEIIEPSSNSYGNNGFYMREIEVAMIAPLDPFTRGKTFFSITENSISIEEAYMEWLNLPLNMNLKTGVFYAEFGPLNRYHDHALPQFDRPKALVNLFSNASLRGIGFAADFMLPTLLFSNASSLNLTLMNGGNDYSFTSDFNSGLILVGQFKNYYDLTDNSFLEFRLSGTTGRNDINTTKKSYVGSLGISYKWVPAGKEKYRTFDLKSELLYSWREVEGGTVHSKGFYVSAQNKLNAKIWLSGRVGYSEIPWDNNQFEWDYTLCIDFWQSEFVLTRFQYQYNWRNKIDPAAIPASLLPNDHAFLIQINWAMGPHKHEAY